MSLPLVETYEPPEIWASISNDIDDLVQNSKPLDQQVLPNLLDLSWSPKFNELLEEGTRIASGAIMRRERWSCRPFGRRAFVKIPPNGGIGTRDKQILVFIPIATLDGGDTHNTPKDIDLSVRSVPGGRFTEFIKAQPGSINVGFENIGIQSSTGCYGILGICRKERT